MQNLSSLHRPRFSPVAITAITLALLSLLLWGCQKSDLGSDPDPTTPNPPTVSTLTLTSSDFTNNGPFNIDQYGNFPSYAPYASANNNSPQLSWNETNTNVNAYILLMVDRSANNWVHWFRVNIKGNSLAKGAGNTPDNHQGFATHYDNGGTSRQYYGPQPPPGTGTHRYDSLLFGIDQASVSLDSYTDYDSISSLYRSLLEAYSNTGTISSATIGGTVVRILSQGKITGTASP